MDPAPGFQHRQMQKERKNHRQTKHASTEGKSSGRPCYFQKENNEIFNCSDDVCRDQEISKPVLKIPSNLTMVRKLERCTSSRTDGSQSGQRTVTFLPKRYQFQAVSIAKPCLKFGNNYFLNIGKNNGHVGRGKREEKELVGREREDRIKEKAEDEEEEDGVRRERRWSRRWRRRSTRSSSRKWRRRKKQRRKNKK
ncbi:hypothetical protein PoB_004347900 [Plakobranchus ocellatus]|uniref:Uncharacterized protein n=1 Tax=Plakobranchus ocellatus TaxID=259542 RepID=A0AAV4BDU6_9GAST|nr:hypothetical protein PoB_004347900 [Plakobranchus ocellatus]